MQWTNSVRDIGPLLDLLEKHGAVKNYALHYSILAHLLPQMRASDANLLLPRHHDHINRLLAVGLSRQILPPYMYDFVLAALKALEQVGDWNSISIVTRLTTISPTNYEQAQIQQAAYDTLSALTQRQSKLRQSATLLRASSAPAPSPDMLLRPAAPTADPAPQQLLRAAPASASPSPETK